MASAGEAELGAQTEDALPGPCESVQEFVPPAMCSCSWEPCGSPGQKALDRLVVAISPTGLYLEGEEEEEEGTSGKGGRVGCGWQGVSSPSGFKEGVREEPGDTEEAPVLLMDLHKRSAAE